MITEFVCIDCGQTAVAKTSYVKRCKACCRLHHNRCNALRMTAKRANPAFREAEREATKRRMRRYRASKSPQHTCQTESASP
jgi:hypothetical protein